MVRWLAAGAALLVAAAAPQQVSVKKEDGTLVVKGEPFFPVGIIHVSSAGNAEKRSSDLQMIAVGGFNVMQAVVKAGDGAFIDEAEALGVHVLGEAADGPALKEAVKDLRGKGSIFGWHLMEDADNGKRLTAEVAALRKEIKALDPGRVTYLTCGDLENCGRFFDGADVIGLKSFPLPGGSLAGPAGLFSAANKAAGETPRSFVAVIQAWAPKGKKPPTSDEIRNMTYQALVHGARGVLFHAYFDKDWDMSGQPDAWNGVRQMASEIQSLRAVLMGGKLQRADTRSEDVFAGVWTFQGRFHVAVINACADPKKVMVQLPPEAAGRGLPQFREIRRRLALEGSKLVGEMGAGEVHVYLFETR